MVCICQSVFRDWYLSECLPGLVFLRVSSMVCISQSVFYGLYLSVSSMVCISEPNLVDTLTNTKHGRHSDKYKP
jgi:hypothetical protein